MCTANSSSPIDAESLRTMAESITLQAVTESNARLSEILAEMEASRTVPAATGVLLAVVMELTVRMRRFQEYPAVLCRMSKRWYPESVAAGNALAFLNTDERQLDIGVGLPLFKHAWQRGTTMNAAQAWLLSPPAQEIFQTKTNLIASKLFTTVLYPLVISAKQ